MDTLLVLLKNVVLSTLHGWVGASLAVFMFFRPLKPWRIGGVRIWQGVIPAQQSRIAEAVGEVVAGELLTTQVLFGYLVGEQTLDNWVKSTVHELADTVTSRTYPALELMFPPSAADLKKELKAQTQEALTRWVLKHLTEPGAKAWLRSFSHGRLQIVWQKKVGELWTEEKAAVVLRQCLEKAAAYLGTPESRGTAARLLEQARSALSQQEMPLRDVLPQELPEQAIKWLSGILVQVLPEVVMGLRNNKELLERLTTLILEIMEHLKERGLLARVGIGLFQYFSEYRAEVRIMVRDEIFPRLSEFLTSPETREWWEQSIREQVEMFLRRPLGGLINDINWAQLTQAGDQLVAGLAERLAGAEAQVSLHRLLLNRYHAIAECTIAELWERYVGVAPEKVEALLVRYGFDLLRRPEAAGLVRQTAGALVEGVARYPLGSLRDLFTPETLAKAESSAAELLTAYLKRIIPSFLGEIDLQTIVRRKIESYSTGELVDMFQRVTMNSLQKIELFGAVIGAAMGVFFGLANLRADAFWFIAAVLAFIIGLLRFAK